MNHLLHIILVCVEHAKDFISLGLDSDKQRNFVCGVPFSWRLCSTT